MNNTNNTPKSTSNDMRNGANTFILVTALCFAGLLPAANVGLKIYEAANRTPFQQDIFDQKLAKLQTNVNAEGPHGKNALHYSIMFKNSNATKILLSQNGINIEQEDDIGRKPLSVAISYKAYDAADLLIENGANVNAHLTNNQTLLHGATIDNQNRFILALLANHANPNSQDDFGNSPLHYAAYLNNLYACRELIAAGANKDARNIENMTPLDVSQSQAIRQLFMPPTPPAPPTIFQTFWEGFEG